LYPFFIIESKDDGAWQFFSNDNFEQHEDVAMIVGLGEIIKLDSSILEIADMPKGYLAERNSKKDSWSVKKNSN